MRLLVLVRDTVVIAIPLLASLGYQVTYQCEQNRTHLQLSSINIFQCTYEEEEYKSILCIMSR